MNIALITIVYSITITILPCTLKYVFHLKNLLKHLLLLVPCQEYKKKHCTFIIHTVTTQAL